MVDSDWFQRFPKGLEPLYSALGKVVYAWAYLENTIDTCCSIVLYKYGGKPKTPKQELPRSLNMKITFLKDSFRQISELIPYQTEALVLIIQVPPLAKKRHDMIHSIFHNTDQISYDFSKYDYQNQHKIVELTFTIPDYLEVGNNILGLSSKWVQFAFYLQNPQYRKPCGYFQQW